MQKGFSKSGGEESSTPIAEECFMHQCPPCSKSYKFKASLKKH